MSGSPLMKPTVRALRLHGLIWVAVIPSAYVAYVVEQFVHAVLGQGLISWLAGAEWHGFSLTRAIVSVPDNAPFPSNLIIATSGYIATFIIGAVLFKFVSRRIRMPALRFVTVMTAAYCMSTAMIPAAFALWYPEGQDFSDVLVQTGYGSSLNLVLISAFGAVGIFYVVSYSITRLLEESWTGNPPPVNRIGSAYMTLGVPLNVLMLILLYIFWRVQPSIQLSIWTLAIGAAFNLIVPMASSHVKSQVEKRRLVKKGLIPIFISAAVLFVLNTGVVDLEINWHDTDSSAADSLEAQPAQQPDTTE